MVRRGMSAQSIRNTPHKTRHAHFQNGWMVFSFFMASPLVLILHTMNLRQKKDVLPAVRRGGLQRATPIRV